MTRGELAGSFYPEKYNCAQSVLAAYSDLFKADSGELLKMSAPFGVGFSGSGLICGAVSGMLMVAGELKAPVDNSDKSGSAELYKLCRFLMDEFKNKNGSLVCSELRRLRQESGGKSCRELVESAAEILEKNVL